MKKGKNEIYLTFQSHLRDGLDPLMLSNRLWPQETYGTRDKRNGKTGSPNCNQTI